MTAIANLSKRPSEDLATAMLRELAELRRQRQRLADLSAQFSAGPAGDDSRVVAVMEEHKIKIGRRIAVLLRRINQAS